MRAVRGTKDILPREAQLWRLIEEAARSVFPLYGYEEIRTPIIEEMSLFTRSIGETTDIVQKQMFTIADRKGRLICLRPEATAPIVRAYLEHSLHRQGGITKLYYLGPMFRSERPQKGRLRQFHQIGIEAIGSSPYLDGEVISCLVAFFRKLNLRGYQIKLNSLGCLKDKKKLGENLSSILKKDLKLLCEDCQSRFKRNVLRILDCKNENCRRLIHKRFTPNFLCSDCLDHFKDVKESLNLLEIPYQVEPYLVRGLDYYTRTVFEVTHPELGGQDAIGAGGRYDNLISDFGGPEKGAIGFALGVERILLVLSNKLQTTNYKLQTQLGVYIATIGEEAYQRGFLILEQLRKSGVSAQIDYESKSLKSQMRKASNLNAKLVTILGEDELKKGIVTVRDMSTGKQEEIALDNFLNFVRDNLGQDSVSAPRFGLDKLYDEADI